MFKKYSQEELWKLYESLPEELKKAIFSKEISDIIYNIGKRHNLEEEKISQIAEGVGYVFLGLLLPAEFEKNLKEEMGIENKIIDGINQEIKRFIFYPFKNSLEPLYNIKIEPVLKPSDKESLLKPLSSKEINEKNTKDPYRESIE